MTPREGLGAFLGAFVVAVVFGAVTLMERNSPLDLGECSIVGMLPIEKQPYGSALFQCGTRRVRIILPTSTERKR